MLHSLQDGRYSILGELGRGGFGITYEASNSRLGRRYAIKEFFMPGICGRGDDGVSVVVPLETNRAIFERQKDRFYQEAGKLAQLYHPHIVTVFDYFEENGTAYYVMDYIEGENLAARLSRTGRPMDEAEVLKILKQVLDALEYIHGQEPPLLHLDIKPANLMIKENGDVVLIDFGASKNLWQDSEAYRSTTLAFSPGFAPLEQSDQDIRKIGPWTDFYSLGATLYNLLANRLPPLPSGIDDDTTGDKHVALSFPENVSGRTRKLVHRLMSTQRIRRPQSVEEIRNLLGGNGYPLKPILLVLLALLVVGFFSMMLYNKANDPFDINEDPEEAIAEVAEEVVDEEAEEVGGAESPSESSDRETIEVNGVSFTMVRVAGGTFTMGATGEQGSDPYDDEKPAHEVSLSTFSIGETEVTQALWQAVMGNNPSKFDGNPQKPVEQVSWKDCQQFIEELNRLTGKTFRLPTEAEWEYAARGGNKSRKTKYSGGSDINAVAWYGDNSGDVTHPVKEKAPNELGLYDMSGNVDEWCGDWYDSYPASPQNNPKGPATGSRRVRRGGSWFSDARGCRVSNRFSNTPGISFDNLGFRLAL